MGGGCSECTRKSFRLADLRKATSILCSRKLRLAGLGLRKPIADFKVDWIPRGICDHKGNDFMGGFWWWVKKGISVGLSGAGDGRFAFGMVMAT